ncbi:unnamed protein product [Urochloa humidicola]
MDKESRKEYILCEYNRGADSYRSVLDKSTCMIFMALSSKALVITGTDDRRYWQHMPTSESRLQSVAYLQQICWFEVVGEVDFCFPVGTYSLYFRVHLEVLQMIYLATAIAAQSMSMARTRSLSALDLRWSASIVLVLPGRAWELGFALDDVNKLEAWNKWPRPGPV